MPTLAASAHDSRNAQAVDRCEDSEGVTLFVGYLADAGDRASEFGLVRQAGAARIARAAWQKFGSQMPAELTGEWSFLHWSRDDGAVLMLSAALRDSLFYAVARQRLTAGPDLFTLADLPWIDATIDDFGLIAGVGNGPVRAATAGSTMFRQIRSLQPGETLHVGSDGSVKQARCDPLTPQPLSTSDPREAVAMYRETLMHVMRERMAGHQHCADLLSGGLDSSLLAWAAAKVRQPDQQLSGITIVGAQGSGVPDERDFAAIVTSHLGMTPNHISAQQDVRQYEPPLHILTSQNAIPLLGRHGTTEAIQHCASRIGATMVFNGTWGETSATSRFPPQTLAFRTKAMLRSMRRQWSGNHVNPNTPRFHLQLARHRRQAVSAPLREALAAHQQVEANRRKSGGLAGYLPAAFKAMDHPNEFYAGAVRMECIFRDIRLLRLFASFPKAMLEQHLADRGIARALLEGGLPDAIRLRVSKGQAFPDNMQRMKREAGDARMRVPLFRAAEIDDWLDLDWLDQQLARVAATGATGEADAGLVQSTAIAAEFLLWWRSRASG